MIGPAALSIEIADHLARHLKQCAGILSSIGKLIDGVKHKDCYDTGGEYLHGLPACDLKRCDREADNAPAATWRDPVLPPRPAVILGQVVVELPRVEIVQRLADLN